MNYFENFNRDTNRRQNKAPISISVEFSHSRTIQARVEYYNTHGHLPTISSMISKTPINYLDGRATILGEVYDNDIWKLAFMYKGKVRKLFYYSRDFDLPWPAEITNISHIIALGAFSWRYLINLEPEYYVLTMMETRTAPNWKYYECEFTSEHFPMRVDGRIKDGKIEIDNSKDVVEQFLSGW